MYEYIEIYIYVLSIDIASISNMAALDLDDSTCFTDVISFANMII